MPIVLDLLSRDNRYRDGRLMLPFANLGDAIAYRSPRESDRDVQYHRLAKHRIGAARRIYIVTGFVQWERDH